jgi:hypothetical protein
LLVLEVCLLFFAAPLEAKGLATVRPISETLVLAVVAIIVMLSRRRGSITAILVGLAAVFASFAFGTEWSPGAASVVRFGGRLLTFSTLIWVVLHAVYARGPITFHRLQGAIVVYLNFAIIFGAAYGLIWELNPAAFVHLDAPTGGAGAVATMLYFSFTTLTTTGYGDILPIDPLARGLANLESVTGQFYIAITIARLVTMEMADRRQ